MRLNLLFILVFGVSTIICTNCPKRSSEDTTDGSCVTAIGFAQPFNDAKRVCNSLGGSLVQIRNSFQNILSSTQIEDGGFANPAFIGVVRSNSSQPWTYADGSYLTYNRWKAGAPLDGPENCAALGASDTFWYPVLCDRPKPFVCNIPASEIACPGSNWTYSSTGNACYYLQAMQNGILYNINTARSACQSLGADLISIHSQQENDFVMDLIATHTSGGINCDNYEAVIGLTMINGVQAWTDGTPFDYDNRGYINFPTYGMSNEPGCVTKKWNYWALSHTFQRFLCKKAPVSLRERILEIIASFDGKGPNKP